MKRLVATILILCVALSLCACTPLPTEEERAELTVERVRAAAEEQGRIEFLFYSIGGKELKSSEVTITNVKKVSDTEYIINGQIVMTDVYGTQWHNTFDCEVTYDEEAKKWVAGEFEYTNDRWLND